MCEFAKSDPVGGVNICFFRARTAIETTVSSDVWLGAICERSYVVAVSCGSGAGTPVNSF
jgi:hypothetical protein